MQAIVISGSGGPDVLRWETVPDPEPGPGEVLLDVAASAVNRADVLQRQGNYPVPPGASPYPGLECGGRIAALGDGVTGWQVGDEVCALLSGGGYAERVAVPAAQLLPIPAGLTPVEAAALPEVACTVWSNVGMRAHLAAGEAFLVHGGASGIGTHAIQLAKALGARVFCTAGSAERLERCRELGAELLIDYKTEDFAAKVKEAGGADVILDHIGAGYLERNLDALATNGRLTIIGMHGGGSPVTEINVGKLMGKRALVTATTLRARPAAEKAEIVAEVREHVWPLVDAKKIKPIIDRVLPMADAADAHRAMEAGENVGKIVLAV